MTLTQVNPTAAVGATHASPLLTIVSVITSDSTEGMSGNTPRTDDARPRRGQVGVGAFVQSESYCGGKDTRLCASTIVSAITPLSAAIACASKGSAFTVLDSRRCLYRPRMRHP